MCWLDFGDNLTVYSLPNSKNTFGWATHANVGSRHFLCWFRDSKHAQLVLKWKSQIWFTLIPFPYTHNTFRCLSCPQVILGAYLKSVWARNELLIGHWLVRSKSLWFPNLNLFSCWRGGSYERVRKLNHLFLKRFNVFIGGLSVHHTICNLLVVLLISKCTLIFLFILNNTLRSDLILEYFGLTFLPPIYFFIF